MGEETGGRWTWGMLDASCCMRERMMFHIGKPLGGSI
jgi:hypothetical protein